MKAISRRLLRLEARLTDCSGRVPHTSVWLEYWNEQIGAIVDGGKLPEGVHIPLTAIDAMLAETPGAER